MPRSTPASRERSVRKLERSIASLATAAIARMDKDLAWYRAMVPEQRSWLGLVIQAGIAAFVDWYSNPSDSRPTPTADIFGTAPRELIRSMSLQQTVEVVRSAIEVVENNVAEVVDPEDFDDVREAILLYSREVAFSAADVYARYAEARGTWDARLEAAVVDALMRGEADEEVRSRASALGWASAVNVAVVIGRPRGGDPEGSADELRRAGRRADLEMLTGAQGDRLVAVLGNVDDPVKVASTIVTHFGPGPVVVGPRVDGLIGATESARSAVSGLIAAQAWPDAPRPIASADLLPERALRGDATAIEALRYDVYQPIVEAGPVIIDTLGAYLETGASVEAAARQLFVHPNTIRYRLKRITDIVGLVPTEPRDAFTLHVALTLGRLNPPPID